jgi:Holliday junction resolvase RusA-like endonuclease
VSVPNVAKDVKIVIPGRPVPKKNSPIRPKGRNIILPSKAYQKYEKHCLKLLRSQEVRFAGLVHVCAIYYLRDYRWWPDLVGLTQATGDILEKAKIIKNDKYIVSWDGSEIAGLDKQNPRAEITVREIADQKRRKLFRLEV